MDLPERSENGAHSRTGQSGLRPLDLLLRFEVLRRCSMDRDKHSKPMFQHLRLVHCATVCGVNMIL